MRRIFRVLPWVIIAGIAAGYGWQKVRPREARATVVEFANGTTVVGTLSGSLGQEFSMDGYRSGMQDGKIAWQPVNHSVRLRWAQVVSRTVLTAEKTKELVAQFKAAAQAPPPAPKAKKGKTKSTTPG